MQKYSIKEETLQDIAGAIRSKCQIEKHLTPIDFKEELSNYNSVLEEHFNYDSDSFAGVLKKLPSYISPSSTSGNYMFYNCIGLEEAPSLEFMKGLTTASRMFYGCKNLKSFPAYDMEGIITDATYMFAESGLEEIPSSNYFNAVTSASRMFENCKNLRKMEASFDALTNASYMFSGCSSLKTIPNLSFDNITDISYCFSNSGLEEIGDMTFSSAVNIIDLFAQCKNLKKVGNLTFPKATSLSYLFYGSNGEEVGNISAELATTCKLRVFPLSVKKIGDVYVPKVTTFYYSDSTTWLRDSNEYPKIEEIGTITCGENPNFNYMFNYCRYLKKIPDIIFDGYATGLSGAFEACGLIESIPNFNVSGITSLYETFYGCKNLKRLPDNWDLSNVSNVYYAFTNCYSLENLGDFELGKITATSLYCTFEDARSMVNHPKMDCSEVTSATRVFLESMALKEIKDLHFDSLTSLSLFCGNTYSLQKVTNVSFNKLAKPSYNLFASNNSGWTLLNNLREINGFYLPAMTDATSLFGGVPRLTTVRKFVAPNNTTATSMFSGKARLENIIECDFGEKLTSMANMFYNCSSLKKAPLLYTGNVTTMASMFYGCANIEEISFYGGCGKLTNVSNMFANIKDAGVFKYDARYNYSAIINELPVGWTTEPLYIPQECTSLEIECDDVIGRATSALIKFKAITKGLDTGTGEIIEGQEITGEWWSDEFEENYSETDSVIREIKFDYMGVEATTTVTQLPRGKAYCAVLTNPNWIKDANIGNPDPELYDGTYINYSTSSYTALKLEIEGYDNFKVYLKYSGHMSYDYMYATDSKGTIITTEGNDAPVDEALIYNYIPAHLYHLGGKKTTITIYRQRSGTYNAAVLIPKNQ